MKAERTALSAHEQHALQLVQQQEAQMLAHVTAWAAINSGSYHRAGLTQMAEILAAAFAPLGGDMRMVPSTVVEEMDSHGNCTARALGDHLHMRKRLDAPLRLCLTGHYDTVFGADHDFQKVWREGERLRGPGVADMKGGIAVILAALMAFEASPFASLLGWDLVLNADEEVGSLGSQALLREVASSAHVALTFEPSLLPDGTLAGARKGSGNFSISVHGKAAHAGRNPQEGRNAIIAAADLALQLAGWPQLREGLQVNVARIEGGGPVNMVPDQAVVRFNVRTSHKQDERWAEESLVALTQHIAARHDVALKVHGGFTRPPKPLDARQLPLFEMVRDCGAALGLQIGWQPSGGVCDGNNLASYGLPVVDTMGVRGGAIHSAQEYLLIDSLVERAQLACLVMMRLAQQGVLR